MKTRIVSIGNLKIGGDNPICIQSMLTSSTQDTARCLEEIKSLVAVACELIRLTIPSRKDLEAVPELKRLMVEEGLDVPLVADIHFSPALAVDACEYFEKVRINPGNYSDKPKNSASKATVQAFDEGREKLKESIKPLIVGLNKYRRALRIGVNQGSLSTRMMERYGDSPQGMVQSALEMVELFEEQGFDQLVISLKSSNPIVVQKAYRLLVENMKNREAVPLHLGVTEAGEGLMGRVKSLAGIGPLLMDGIGDTVRVSLTEPSANEIVFARKLLPAIRPSVEPDTSSLSFWERELNEQRVSNGSPEPDNLKIGNKQPLKIGVLEGIRLPDTGIPFNSDFTYRKKDHQLFLGTDDRAALHINSAYQPLENLSAANQPAVVFSGEQALNKIRYLYSKYGGQFAKPVGCLVRSPFDYHHQTQLSAMLSEGLLDFMLIPEDTTVEELQSLLYLLQATRTRILVTDYIVCPSCGRTLFDIQKTTALIKQRTSHLKGLKIGVMGCIVNGPGEMADADFGYVGSGKGKIDLYFGQEKVGRGIDENEAVDRLIDLIKEKGFWKEK